MQLSCRKSALKRALRLIEHLARVKLKFQNKKEKIILQKFYFFNQTFGIVRFIQQVEMGIEFKGNFAIKVCLDGEFQ